MTPFTLGTAIETMSMNDYVEAALEGPHVKIVTEGDGNSYVSGSFSLYEYVTVIAASSNKMYNIWDKCIDAKDIDNQQKEEKGASYSYFYITKPQFVSIMREVWSMWHQYVDSKMTHGF